MTSRVTVDAHAGWPISVTRISLPTGEKKELETVQPGMIREFHVWDDSALMIVELPRSKFEDVK